MQIYSGGRFRGINTRFLTQPLFAYFPEKLRGFQVFLPITTSQNEKCREREEEDRAYHMYPSNFNQDYSGAREARPISRL